MRRSERGGLRPSLATIISGVALFVALGGTALAVDANSVNSRHIIDGAVKSKDLRDGTVKTRDVKDGNLTGADIADGSVDTSDLSPASVGAEQLANESVGTRHLQPGSISGNEVADQTLGVQHLALKCGPTRTKLDGLCWDSTSRAVVEQPFGAESICRRAGGRLPTAFQMRSAAVDLNINDAHHWTDAPWYEGNALLTMVVASNGGMIPNEPNTAYPFVCVYELVA